MTNDDYCPIRTRNGKCKIGGECDHIRCVEKMRYKMPSIQLEQKMSKWASHRRGELRYIGERNKEKTR